jgi:hypothetical protein
VVVDRLEDLALAWEHGQHWGGGGRGALTIVTRIDDRAEWEKCEEKCRVRRGREKGGGMGQNACTCPYIEGYRGKVGAKNAILPQKCAENPPKISPLNSGAGLGCVSVSWCDVTPQQHPRDPQGEKNLSPL